MKKANQCSSVNLVLGLITGFAFMKYLLEIYNILDALTGVGVLNYARYTVFVLKIAVTLNGERQLYHIWNYPFLLILIGLIFNIYTMNKTNKNRFYSFVLEEKKMYIVNLTYIKSLEDVEKHLPEHITFLNKYYDNGNFICSGRKNPRTGGVIICNAKNMEEVNEIINEDPFNKNGIANYDIVEFEPTKYAEDFKTFVE